MTRYKVGQTLYEATINEPDGSFEWNEHVVRTIRGGRVYAILKTSFTWGKRSKKHGDFGWLDPLPKWCRTSWREGDNPPEWRGMATTKLAALRACRKAQIKYGADEDYEGVTLSDIIKKLDRMIARELNIRTAR